MTQKEQQIDDIYKSRELDAEQMPDRYLDWQETDEHLRSCSIDDRQWQQEEDWHNQTTTQAKRTRKPNV